MCPHTGAAVAGCARIGPGERADSKARAAEQNCSSGSHSSSAAAANIRAQGAALNWRDVPPDLLVLSLMREI